MSGSLRRVLLAALLLASWWPARPAEADTVTRYALEWLVASSEHVVEGEVVSLKAVPGQRELLSVSLKTTRPALKGSSSKGFTAVLAGKRLTRGPRVIIFTKTEYAPGSCGRDPRTGKLHLFPRQRITRVLTGANRWVVPTRDFQQTRGLADLKRRIRAAARTVSAKRSIALPIPTGSPIAGGPLDSGTLIVPRDRVTEKLLKSWIASKVADRRIQGITLLEAYESRPNIRLLLKLRREPALRQAAERVLRIWNIPQR